MKTHLLNPGKLANMALARLAQQNYYSAKAYYHHKLHRSTLEAKEPPLLIYQMGKVGSSSVQASLKALNLDMPIYHPHFLTQDFMDLYEQKRKKYFGTNRISELKHIWQCQYLSKQIEKGLNGKKWRAVTLVREPIARNISAFFETLEVEVLSETQFKLTADIRSTYNFEITVQLDDVEELIEIFLREFDHETPLVFFDREIKGVLGVDVFATEFPDSIGYKIYEGAEVDVLLIRLENLTECARDAFKEFLNVEDFSLTNTNIGSEKDYAPIYKKLKDSIRLPDSYIDEMYTSKYTRHFYSEAEIARFETRWRRNMGS